jgi:porin
MYELWYEHTFDLYNTDLSMLIGQHDLNSEFIITDYGLLFLQSSFGINNEISNNIPLSNFPVAALGFRIKWEPTESLYLMAEISDGDAGKDESGLHWTLNSEEGLVTFYELGYHFGDKDESRTMPGTYKFGWWYHTAEFDDVRDVDVSGNPIEHSDNYGIYFIADQMLFPGEGEKGLGAFVQVGGVPKDRNEVDFYIGGGIHYRGLIPSREDDIFGLAVAHASISEDLRDVKKMDRHETAIEATYRVSVFPFLAVQPGLQVVFNPGADSSLDNAIVSILRVQITF